MKNCPFDPAGADRRMVERVIAWINSQPYKSSTKEDLKILVRKLVQYAKCGSYGRNTPVPPEVSWFSINRSEKDSKVKPEMLLSIENVKAMINAAENERDRALISVLFEAALRPSEKSIFAALRLRKSSLCVRIRVDPEKFKDPDGWTGNKVYKNWIFKYQQGVQEREFKISGKEQMPYAMELIRQAYEVEDKKASNRHDHSANKPLDKNAYSAFEVGVIRYLLGAIF